MQIEKLSTLELCFVARQSRGEIDKSDQVKLFVSVTVVNIPEALLWQPFHTSGEYCYGTSKAIDTTAYASRSIP